MLFNLVPELMMPEREGHKTSEESAPPDSQEGEELEDTFYEAGGLWKRRRALISFEETRCS